MFLRFEPNEYGHTQARHRCEACGDEYTINPPFETSDGCGRPPWLDHERGACPSYEEGRDVSKMLREGTVELHSEAIVKA